MMSAATALLQPYPTMSDGADDRANGPESSFDLVLRANRGEHEALDTLMARYLPRLQRWAHGRLPPAARSALQTQDLVQDTLKDVIEHLPSFAVDVVRRWPSVEKAERLLGWKAQIGVEEGIAQTVAWLREREAQSVAR